MTTPERPRIPNRIRIGSVPYLNAVPLTRGMESEIAFLPPNELGQALRDGLLDAALLSITEVIFDQRYRILDGMGVCSRGPVSSVFLAHKSPLTEVKEIHCDPATLTSVNLLRVLLKHQGIEPKWQPLRTYEDAVHHDNVLLIGNPAIQFRQEYHPHQQPQQRQQSQTK